MDLSVTPVAQFGTLATHGSPLDGRRQGQDSGHNARQQAMHINVQQQAAQSVPQSVVVPPHGGQVRPVEAGKNANRARNNGQQTQPDLAQAAANVQDQTAASASRAVATRYALQSGQYGPIFSGYGATGTPQRGFGAKPSPQAMQQASTVYASMERQGVMTKALAPWGTGISLHI